MKKVSLIKVTVAVIFISLMLITAFTCTSTKSAMVYGVKWTGLIRTPLVPPYQTPGNPPYMIHEDINFSGGFGELAGDLSKYNLLLESNSLSIKHDTPGSNETLADIWYSYSDTGVKSDGSREVYLKGRCYLTNKKLNPIHPDGSLDFNLKLVITPNQPFFFVMNVLTTKKGTASDLMISGKAEPPDGVIQFMPVN